VRGQCRHQVTSLLLTQRDQPSFQTFQTLPSTWHLMDPSFPSQVQVVGCLVQAEEGGNHHTLSRIFAEMHRALRRPYDSYIP